MFFSDRFLPIGTYLSVGITVWSDLARQRNGGFVLCSAFLEKKWPVGGLTSHSQIATGGLNLINPPRHIIQTYHNQPLDGWALTELAGGWKGGSVLLPEKFNKKLTFGGGVSHSQIASSRPNLNIQTYHNQPLGGWALAASPGGFVLWP